jgi:hypothetical protein
MRVATSTTRPSATAVVAVVDVIEQSVPLASEWIALSPPPRLHGGLRRPEGPIVVPERAVSELQDQHQVHVVDRDNRVQIRSVTVGERLSGAWIIPTGLHAGERVAAGGAQFLAPGTAFLPQPFIREKRG